MNATPAPRAFLSAAMGSEVLDFALVAKPALWHDEKLQLLAGAILIPTAGHLVFEEQLGTFLTRVAQFRRSQVELLRTSLSRGDRAELTPLRELFVLNLVAQGVNGRVASAFWDQEILKIPKGSPQS
jgi:DNA polymerase III alpha subunit